MANSLVERMQKGEKQAIVEGLMHQGAIYRMNAISFSSICKLKDAEVETRIKDLKDDNVMLDGYSVSDFAHAALELMGVELYIGNKTSVKELINSEFEFLKQ